MLKNSIQHQCLWNGNDLGCSVSGFYLPKGIVPCAVKVPCANMEVPRSFGARGGHTYICCTDTRDRCQIIEYGLRVKFPPPGGSGLRILPHPEFLSVYEARKKAPHLGKFLRGANVRLQSLLLDFMYDTLHWKLARSLKQQIYKVDCIIINILYQIAIQLGRANRTRTVRGMENNLITKYAAVVLIV